MAHHGVQAGTPYLDALRAYAARSPGRFHVPGHKGGAAADPARARPDGGDERAEGDRAAGHGQERGLEIVGGGEVEDGLGDHAPSSRRTWGSTSRSARRRSSAKSISVHGRPVTSTQPT